MRLPANSSGGSGGRHPRPGKLSWLTCGQMSVGKLVPRLVLVFFSLRYLLSLLLSHHVPFTESNIRYSWLYMINSSAPGPQPLPHLSYAHMGMLEKLSNGSLAAAFQGSPQYYEGSSEQSLYWTTSNDGGERWGPIQLLVAGDGVPLWSPVLLSEGGRLWLFYAKSVHKCRYFDRQKNVHRFSPGGDILYLTSDDNGRTWSDPQMVYGYERETGIPKVIANKVSILSTGAWVLPFWREPGKTCPTPLKSKAAPHPQGSAGVMISGDQGLTWAIHGAHRLADSWLIESTLVELADHRLLQIFRSKKSYLYQSWSHDGGSAWTSPSRSSLPNPDAKAHVQRLANGELLLAYNHSKDKRTPLYLATSRDEGASWRTLAHVETDTTHMYAYPTVLEMPPPVGLERSRLLVVYSVMKPEARADGGGGGMRAVSRGIRLARLDDVGRSVMV